MAETNAKLLVRVVSALVLLPGVLVLTWLGGWPFAALLAVAAGACAWELAAMTMGRSHVLHRAFTVAAAAALPLLFHFADAEVMAALSPALFPGLLVLFFVGAVLRPSGDLMLAPSWVAYGVIAVLWAGGLLACVELVRARGPDGFWWVILLMAVTWLNDTGAYFAGRAFGRHKLAPRISPGKTWEGFFGGVLGSIGGAFLVAWVSGLLHFPGMAPLTLAPWILLAIGSMTGVMGPVGDLAESMAKRAFGVKDSGRLIPGHGGVLDRIDALLFNAIVLYGWHAVLA